VRVNWVGRLAGETVVQVEREIGWNDLPENLAADGIIAQWRRAVPPQDITEQAAIAIMALLIHDLDQGEVLSALPIGSGGDYLVAIRGLKKPVQSESSGIRLDATGSESRQRLKGKMAQVVSKSRAGFAAVTTFSHGPECIVHSYLHFARQGK